METENTDNSLGKELPVSDIPAPERKIYKVFRTPLLISVIFLIPLIIFTFYLIYLYFRPQNVLDRALLKTVNVDYLGYNGRIVTSMEGEYNLISIIIPNSYSVTANVSGALDFKDKEYPKLLTNAKLLIQGLFNAELEIRSFPRNIYIKAKSLPDLGIVNADKYLNRWILLEIPEDEKTEKKDSLPLEMVWRKRPMKVTEDKGKSMIDRREHYSYKYEIDKEALFDLITYYYESTGNSLSYSDSKTLSKLKERLRFSEGTIWIDKKELYVKKFTIVGQLWPGETGDKRIIHFNADFTLNDINKAVEIPQPEKSETINEMLGITP